MRPERVAQFDGNNRVDPLRFVERRRFRARDELTRENLLSRCAGDDGGVLARDRETANKMFQPNLPVANSGRHKNFPHLERGRFRGWPISGSFSLPARASARCRESFFPDSARPARTRMNRRRSQDRPARVRRAQRSRADQEARRMFPGSVQSRNKNGAVARRFNQPRNG